MALIPLNTFKTKTAVLTTLKYNQAKCARDTALIIDSIAFDLLYGGNTQTAFAAVQYWSQGETKIPGDVLQTLSATQHAKEVALKIVMNETVTPTSGNSQTQVTGTPGSLAGKAIVDSEFDLIIDIIENGTAGTTDKIVSNSDLVSNSGLLNTANLLASNKAFLQSEIVAYVNQKFGNGYTYDSVKCARDTGLIIDSLAFDLLFGGSTQSSFAGLQYWSQGTTSIPNESAQTIAAMNQLKTLMLNVITNQAITAADGNLLTQVTNSTIYISDADSTTITDLFTDITTIITSGTTGATDLIVPNGIITDNENLLDVFALIKDNKKFLQADIVAWISNNIATATVGSIWNSFSYDSDKCYRDVGYIIDCVSFDLIYGGNRQSIQAAVYYYGFSNTISSIPNEISESISAYNYLKSLMSYVIEGQPVIDIYQNDISQIIDLPKGSSVETSAAMANIDLITDIIQNGPELVTEKMPIGLVESIDSSTINAFNMLIANKEFLKAEIIQYINTTTQDGFVYNQTFKAGSFIVGNTYTITYVGSTDFTAIGALANTIGSSFVATGAGTGTGIASSDFCRRDIGFIVDCITFDIKHTGNRQAIQAGVYYYNNSSSSSVVASEKTDTINAYNYMAIVMASVIQNVPLTQQFIIGSLNGSKYLNAPYQTNINQFMELTASTSTVSSSMYSLINTLTQIINLGPSLAPPRVPISSTASTNTDVVNAFNLLMANKAYITAEIIGYMDILTSPNTTKIYTAPPGVTAIVLMAQVANVTDRNITITFAHYRNLPVFADPATLNGFQAGDTITEIVREFTIPPNDSATLIQGKMIIESFDSIVAYASQSHGLKVTLSILETANA